ncbi:VOC family protein [Jatrophihabitans fulvus]
MERLSNDDIAAAGLADWRKLAQSLHARFTGDAQGIASMASLLARLERPFSAGQGFLDVEVCTDADGRWVTADDVDAARAISEQAREHGLTAQPGEVAQLEWGLDTARADVVGPFWSALLTGSSATVHGEVLDPTRRVPNVWFQGAEQIETPPQRWHGDLWLAPEVAEGRIAAAVAAGGAVVDRSGAPSYTVLADPDGNRVCVCTSLDRS